MAPEVSCLCVSRERRWPRLCRAALDFLGQDLPGRELVVVVPEAATARRLRQFLEPHLTDAPVKVFERRFGNYQQGLLYALAQARGEFVAAWDDDNQNHPARLRVQLAFQRLERPCGLTALAGALHHWPACGEVCLSWLAAEKGLPLGKSCAASTLLAHRDALPGLGPELREYVPERLLTAAPNLNIPVRLLASWDAYYLHMVGVGDANLRGDLWGLALDRTVQPEPGREAALLAYRWDRDQVRLLLHAKGVNAVDVDVSSRRWPAGVPGLGELP